MLLALALVLGGLPVQVEPAPGRPASLDWDQPVLCLRLPPTRAVPSGNFRVQCDLAARTCLAAPDRVLVDGVESDEPLARVRHKCHSFSAPHRHRLPPEFRVVEGVAEAPPGWYRDERGRVMQVNFDLGRRVYLGGAWGPYGRPDGTGFVAGRARVDFGVDVTVGSRDDSQQHRLHFLETSAWLGNTPRDTRFEATVARYALSYRRERAPFWITTFVGAPRRFDLPLNFGWGAEAGRFEVLGGKSFVTFLELDATLDLWTSADLDSFVRLRAGPALEYDLDTRGAYLRPAVALEADLTLDRDGFHHLTASAAGEKLFFEPTLAGRPRSPQRLRLKAGYEVILVALNDYPLTLVVDARAFWRDDVPALPGWEFSGNVGLRFSLWAPARRSSVKLGVLPAAAPAPVVAPAPIEEAPGPVEEAPAPSSPPVE